MFLSLNLWFGEIGSDLVNTGPVMGLALGLTSKVSSASPDPSVAVCTSALLSPDFSVGNLFIPLMLWQVSIHSCLSILLDLPHYFFSWLSKVTESHALKNCMFYLHLVHTFQRAFTIIISFHLHNGWPLCGSEKQLSLFITLWSSKARPGEKKSPMRVTE